MPLDYDSIKGALSVDARAKCEKALGRASRRRASVGRRLEPEVPHIAPGASLQDRAVAIDRKKCCQGCTETWNGPAKCDVCGGEMRAK